MLELKKINSLQVPTWNWLKVNDTSIEVPEEAPNSYSIYPLLKDDKLIKVKINKSKNIILKERAKSPVKDYINNLANYQLEIEIPENTQLKEPILLEFLLDENNPIIIDKILINAKAGSEAVILMNYKAGEKGIFHANSTEVIVDIGANLKLGQIQMLKRSQKNLDIIEAIVEEKGNLQIILTEIGAERLVSECNMVLNGKNANANLYGIYIGGDEDSLDMNYRLEFRGEKTEGGIDVKGVLLGNSSKKLRSTLDFIKGAVEAKGSESETVVVLSEDAINISAPLLLCEEDNVEGLHSTSTGSPDEGKLFYLMSRGLSEKEAKTLIIEATMTPIIDKIPDENIRSSILEVIGGRIYG